jgi:hypothetical protein
VRNIWEFFGAKGPTERQLVKRAKNLAPLLLTALLIRTSELYEALRGSQTARADDGIDIPILSADPRGLTEALRPFANKSCPEEVGFMFEQLLMALHLINRFAFSRLSPEKRALFTDSLVSEVLAEVTSACRSEEDVSQSREDFLAKYNDRGTEYARFKRLLSSEGEDARGTLLWEYGKMMQAQFFSDRGQDAIATLMIGHAVMQVLERLKVEELFVV